MRTYYYQLVKFMAHLYVSKNSIKNNPMNINLKIKSLGLKTKYIILKI